MLTAARVLAAHHGSAAVPDVLCTLLYIVFIVAIVLAAVGLLMSLIGGTTRWGRAPIFTNWYFALAVALIAGLLLWLLC